MIQVGRKLSLISLIICFCLLQRGIVVYGQGVTIDFSSVTYGGIQINTSSWGNTNIPSSPPTTPTPITPSIPTSPTGTSSTSTYSSTQTQTINLGISSTSTNLNNLTSSYQKLNNSKAGQSGYYNPYVPTELNKELIRSATFSPLSEKEPLLPDAEPYIVTVCLPFNNSSVSGCFDKVNNIEQASEKLAGILLNRYFNGTISRPFRVILPLVMPIKEQKYLLHQIEIQAIAIVESRVFNADGAFIKEYDKIAREEAKIGVNWSHTSKDDKSINDFQTKKAFTKLNNIAIQEKNLISKNFKSK